MIDDPYEVLGLPPSADEAEIRQKYLARVRQFPPDGAPEEFARTRAAYEALRDPVQRMEDRLFRVKGIDTLDAVKNELVRSLRDVRFSTEQLMKLAETP